MAKRKREDDLKEIRDGFSRPEGRAVDAVIQFIQSTGADVGKVLSQMAQRVGEGIGGAVQDGANGIQHFFAPTPPLSSTISDVRGRITGQGSEPRAGQPTSQQPAQQPSQQPAPTAGQALGTGILGEMAREQTGQAPGSSTLTNPPVRSDGTNQTILTQRNDGSSSREPSVSSSGVRTFESRSLNRVLTPQNVAELSNEEAVALLQEMDPRLAAAISAQNRTSGAGQRMIRGTIMEKFGAME